MPRSYHGLEFVNKDSRVLSSKWSICMEYSQPYLLLGFMAQSWSKYVVVSGSRR